MELNIEAIKQLIKERFKNNKTWFAEEIGVDRSYISKILNEKTPAKGFKIINAIIHYCVEKNMNYMDYINFFGTKN